MKDHPSRSSVEDRYRETLQAIAAGRSGQNRAMPSGEAQQLARKALVEMGDDWTRRGAPDRPLNGNPEAGSLTRPEHN